MYKILLVDDHSDYFSLVRTYNEVMNINYELNYLSTGLNIKEYLDNHKTDLILMDWKLDNDEDGLEIIKSLKLIQCYGSIPMILVTSKCEINDQIKGLNGGADDYITKPFCMELLFCKINAFLRKDNKKKNTQENIQHQFRFNDETLEIEFLGINHKLSAKEFKILKILVNEPLKAHSQIELNEKTSGKDVFVSKRCIDTFITILRKKIGKDSILSIRKKGYKINEELFHVAPLYEKSFIPYS